MEEDNSKISSFNCYINIVEIIIPRPPPTIQYRYKLGLCEFDITMINVSIVLDQDLMLYRLISNVMIRRKKHGYNTYTYKRHHGISAYLLVRKLFIVLDKSKCALQSTT